MIRVRVDDFPHTRGEPQHTRDAFRGFHRELSSLLGGRRYLLGVIPGRCSPEDLIMLRDETDCVIGMHGTDHDESRLDRNGGNQFEGYLSAMQVSRTLYENATALRGALGRTITIYMPPRNVIDARTVSLLRGSGFCFFTGGPETSRDVMSLYGDMCIDSQPPYEYGRSDELLQRRAHLRIMEKSDHGHDVVLTLHWTWEVNIGLSNLRAFLSQIPTRYFGDFDG